jgi:four helix bundle protein
VAKLSIVEEETDECLYWLKLLETTKSAPFDRIRTLEAEADELLSIIIASKKTARKRGL